MSPAFTATKTRRLLPLITQRAAHLTRLAAEEATKGSVEVGASAVAAVAGFLLYEGEMDLMVLGMCRHAYTFTSSFELYAYSK